MILLDMLREKRLTSATNLATAGQVDSSGKYRIELCQGWTGCGDSSEFIGFNNKTCSAGVPPVSNVYGNTVGPMLRSSGVSANWRTWVVDVVSKKTDRTIVTIKNDYSQAKCTNHYIDDYSEKKDACKGTVWSDRVHLHKFPGEWTIKPAKGTNGKCFNIINHQKPVGCLRYLSANDNCKERHLKLVAKDDGQGLQQWKLVRVGGSSPSPSLPGSTCVSTGPACADCCKSKFEKMDGSFTEDPSCFLTDEYPQCDFELGPSPSPTPPTPSRSAPKLVSTASGSPTAGKIVFEPEQGAVECTVTATPQGGGPSVSATVGHPLSFPTTSVNLHNLSPGTDYSVQLTCEDGDGEKESSSNKKALHTMPSDAHPGIVNLHPTSPTSVAFQIVAPDASKCEAERYDVLWARTGGTISKETVTSLAVNLSGLSPGNLYEIAVDAICKGGSVTKKSAPAFVTMPLVPPTPTPSPPGPQQPSVLDKAPTFHTISVFGPHPEVSVYLPSGAIPSGTSVVIEVDCTNGFKTTASAPASVPETDLHLPVGLPPDASCTFTGYTTDGSKKSPSVIEVRDVPSRAAEAPTLANWIPSYQTRGGTIVVVAPQSPNCTISQYTVTGTESDKGSNLSGKRKLLQASPTFTVTTPNPGTVAISNSVNYGTKNQVLNMEVVGQCTDGTTTPSGYMSVKISSCPVIPSCDAIDDAGGVCKCKTCATGFIVSATGYSCSAAPPPPPPLLFYLDANGVTVKCPNAPIGSTGVVNGVTYTRRDRNGLEALVGSSNFAELATSCISGVDNLAALLERLGSFNEDIRSWDTSSVSVMSFLFRGASAFNQDISSWNTSAVTSMNSMFEDASSFNRDIGSWDTRKVKDMYSIFNGASSFNQDISGWNTGAVESLSLAFRDATAFNQDLSSWTAAPGFCSNFADGATAWLAAYGGSSIRSTPPLSPSMLAAGCGP